MSVGPDGYPWSGSGQRYFPPNSASSGISPSEALALLKVVMADAVDNAGDESELRMAMGIKAAFEEIEEGIGW